MQPYHRPRSVSQVKRGSNKSVEVPGMPGVMRYL